MTAISSNHLSTNDVDQVTLLLEKVEQVLQNSSRTESFKTLKRNVSQFELHFSSCFLTSKNVSENRNFHVFFPQIVQSSVATVSNVLAGNQRHISNENLTSRLRLVAEQKKYRA